MRGNCRRNAQSVIIAVRHDHAADHPGRDTPACRVAMGFLTLTRLESDASSFCEIGAEIMRCSSLQGLAILHHRFDRPSFNRAGEAFILRLLARDHRHGEIFFSTGPIHLKRALCLFESILARFMRRMPLLPKKFTGAQEHPCAHFPAHDVSPLIGEQRQVAPALNPARHCIANNGFRSWPYNQRLFKFCSRIGDEAALSIGD